MHKHKRGFTIVEIMIVVVVIGILASIAVVTFRGSPERAEFTRALSDMKHINDAITVYRAQKGTYPAGNNACQDVATSPTPPDTTPPLSASLVPAYLDAMLVPPSNKTAFKYQYCADVNGSNYKLIRTVTTGLPDVEKNGVNAATPNDNITAPALSSTANSWGYWTAGAASL